MVDPPCAFILAGGQGSRLRPYTKVLPKPLIPLCDLPISEILIHQLRRAGFRRLIMGVNHHEALLRSYFRDGKDFGVDISYSRENRQLGTVAPLHLVADRLPEHFLVLNGDLLTDLDFRAFAADHRTTGCDLSIATFRRSVRIGDGVIDIADDGSVSGFREKPQLRFWVSMGIYAMKRSILDIIPNDRPFGMDQLVLTMLKDRRPVQTHRHQGQWYDIGCPTDLERATQAFSEQRSLFLPADAGELAGVA